MSVKFCIVAKDAADAKEIAKAAKPIADMNTYGREILKRGDNGFPLDEAIARWANAENVSNPGAVVLSSDGTFSSILSVSDAKIGVMIEGAFADAA